MARKRVVQRGSYNGPVDVLIDGSVVGQARAHLVGHLEQLDAPGAEGGNEWIDGLRSWDGHLNGVDGDVAWTLSGIVAQLRTPDGRVGDFIATNLPAIGGSGEPPFDM